MKILYRSICSIYEISKKKNGSQLFEEQKFLLLFETSYIKILYIIQKY